jgi:hypothetical protein
MFILPAHAHPFDAVAFPAADWHWLFAPLRLPLTLVATLLVFLVVRAVLLSRVSLTSQKGVPVALVEKAEAAKPKPAPASKQSSWFGVKLSWETLPSVNAIAEALPISLNPPPPPAMRGRHVYRGGRGVGFNVRRPEAALAVRPRIEAPLPAIYESETPVSMAKMIMSRHTYRAPSPRRAPSASSPSSSRPPSPEHVRSVSV